jgi:predicted phosphodiesterase
VRILPLSDLHFEFHADHGRDFVRTLDAQDVDVVVLAGDIEVGEAIPDALALFCERFSDAVVVYVHGNHEYYGTTREAVRRATEEAVRALDNLCWLDASLTTIHGRRVLGAPLWFLHDAKNDRLRSHMSDFQVIREFESWVYEDNARAREFFEAELCEGDIVVTHHLPSQKSVTPEYVGHPLNPFFVCDVEVLIRERAPSLWIHGHTHASLEYDIGSTKVVCNPFGYAAIEENRAFSEDWVIEV